MDDNNQNVGLNNTMIATISTPYSLISGSPAPGLIKFDKEVISYTVIQNCSPWCKQQN
jgi:hypothetical protein